jgi:hypothetical protein
MELNFVSGGEQKIYTVFYCLMKLLCDLLRRYLSILKCKDIEYQLKKKSLIQIFFC